MGGLLGGISGLLFGNTDTPNQQYLQQVAQQQAEAEQARQQQLQAYAQQQRFAAYLQAVISGRAPSMAQLQLEQGLGAITQNQNSMAAGLGGAGNALARYGAAANTGQAQTALNQQQALARAAETAAATNTFGANAASMTNSAANSAAASNRNALGYADLATQIDQANKQRQTLLGGAGLQGIGQASAAYFGGSGRGSSSGADTSSGQ